MRLLLSADSKRKLFLLLKNKYSCKSISELSKKMSVPIKTLQTWFYRNDRLVPAEVVSEGFSEKLEIVDKREDNWGQLKGGRESYNLAIKMGGINEFRRRQSLGGKRGARTKELRELDLFKIDLQDPKFLEFYGNLLGDGWLSNFLSGGKTFWLVGFCCNLTNEKELIKNYQKSVENLFKRKRKISEIPKNNTAVLVFNHKILLKYLNEKLKFPIGKKENLKIHESVCSMGFSKLKYVLRGLFDTDGSLYLQKNKKGLPVHPIVSLHMNEVALIKQIGGILEKEGFRVNYSDNYKMIKMQGKEQARRWLAEVGSSNPYKIGKIKKVL